MGVSAPAGVPELDCLVTVPVAWLHHVFRRTFGPEACMLPQPHGAFTAAARSWCHGLSRGITSGIVTLLSKSQERHVPCAAEEDDPRI